MPFISGALFFNALAAAVAVPSAVGLFKLTGKGTGRGRMLRIVLCTLLAVVLFALMVPFFWVVAWGLLSPGGYL